MYLIYYNIYIYYICMCNIYMYIQDCGLHHNFSAKEFCSKTWKSSSKRRSFTEMKLRVPNNNFLASK